MKDVFFFEMSGINNQVTHRFPKGLNLLLTTKASYIICALWLNMWQEVLLYVFIKITAALLEHYFALYHIHDL